MGISYSARVVIGFKLDVREVTKTVTKYNEDTGKPYEAEVPSHRVGSIDGIDAIDERVFPDAMYDEESFGGLTVFESGYEGGTKVLGVEMAKVSDCYNDFATVQLAAYPAINDFAAKHGVVAGIYLLLSCR